MPKQSRPLPTEPEAQSREDSTTIGIFQRLLLQSLTVIEMMTIKQGRVDIQPVIDDSPLIVYILGLA